MIRSEEWRDLYQEQGFIVVPDLLDQATLNLLQQAMMSICQEPDKLTKDLQKKLFFEREHVQNNPQWYTGRLTPADCGESIRQIDDLALFHRSFLDLIGYPPLLDMLELLFESSEFSFNYLNGRPKAARVGNGISNGNFHRDTPFEEFTSVNTILVILCLNDMMSENGATAFIAGSHKVSDQEAQRSYWRDVATDSLDLTNKVEVRCPAGAGIFFNTKILHAAGHNRSQYPRHTILAEWVGPDVLPTSSFRYSYQGLKPRSKDPAFQQQLRMVLS